MRTAEPSQYRGRTYTYAEINVIQIYHDFPHWSRLGGIMALGKIGDGKWNLEIMAKVSEGKRARKPDSRNLEGLTGKKSPRKINFFKTRACDPETLTLLSSS